MPQTQRLNNPAAMSFRQWRPRRRFSGPVGDRMENASNPIVFHLSANGAAARTISLSSLVIAGWTGRDAAAVTKHIRELEELGVRPPASTPVFYRASASRLTTNAVIEASGGDSSGEVEFVLVAEGGRIYVGVGSDHTDRNVETYNITVSKQICDKPIAPELWALEDVESHWDSLILRSWASFDAAPVLYQEGCVAAMMAPADLLALYEGEFADGAAMFCGTFPAIGGIRPASRFAFELFDPVLDRRITHAYAVKTLPIVG
jgi:hypothetical protein